MSSSGYHEWRDREDSETARRRAYLSVLVKKAFDDSEETYGHRRSHAQRARWGERRPPEFLRSILRGRELVPRQPRPWRRGFTDADPTAAPIPDLVARDVTAAAPGEKMVGDITDIPTWDRWVYLATVIDRHTKAVIGWAMDDTDKTPLIETAIRMAARNYRLARGAIFHTDRGRNDTSRQFAETLESLDIRHSVGRTGIWFDNAMAESFFGTPKNERVHRTVYPTRRHAMTDMARYVEVRYTTQRLHSGLGYKTPHEVHTEHLNQQFAA